MKKIVQALGIVLLLLIMGCNSNDQKKTKLTAATDPLPSWNEGPLKQSLIAYVTAVTDSGSANFIPSIDRIATFDNDGTLWAERPYVQELFAFYQVKKMVVKKPELKTQQPFKAVIENDKAYFKNGGEKVLLQLIAATHTGMTEDEFETSVKDFFAEATYPVKNVPVRQIVYQPQIELLQYLRANGFITFICTGGTVEFVKAFRRSCMEYQNTRSLALRSNTRSLIAQRALCGSLHQVLSMIKKENRWIYNYISVSGLCLPAATKGAKAISLC
jgi:phosphoserine phosphatase